MAVEPASFDMVNLDGEASNQHVVVTREKQADDISGRLKRSLCQRFLSWDGSLLVFSLVGAAVGFSIGLSLYYLQASSTAIVWIGLPGELYMRMLKAAVLPLIISSIITGTAGLAPKENGRVSAVAMCYIIITNITGAVVGTVLAVIVKPGASGMVDSDNITLDTGHLETSDLFADLIRNLVPDNMVTACFQKSQTLYKEKTTAANTTEIERYLGASGGTNILGLVIVSAALGMATAQNGELGRPFLDFFKAAAEIIICLIQKMIWLTPLGVASLIATAVGSSQDLAGTFQGLGLFVLAEVIGILLTGIVFIALLYFVFFRKNPFLFLTEASRAVVTGVASASSAVAMPEVLNCVEQKYNVDHRVSRFVAPLAAALNRDGSAMFIACTSVYMAQLQGSTEVTNIILILVLSSVGSLASPAVPSSSIVTILMILASLDISPANIGIVIALEWFSDRIRTMPNVYSQVLCALVTWHFCKSSLHLKNDTTQDTKDQPSK